MQRPPQLALVAPVWLIVILAAAACQPEELPPPEDLLFTEGELPGHWKAQPEGPHVPTGQAPLGGGPGATDASVVYFHHPAGDGSAGAHEEIFLFGSESDAHEEFNDLLPTAFNDAPDWRWAETAAASAATPSASESAFRCTEGRTEVMCRLVVRYGRYLVDLKVDLDGTNSDLEPVRVISVDDLMRLILLLDERMAFTLQENQGSRRCPTTR
jgi:hypothetical protein